MTSVLGFFILIIILQFRITLNNNKMKRYIILISVSIFLSSCTNNEKNEKEIEICLQRLIEDKELRFKYGNNAQNSVKKYDLDNNILKLEKMYKRNLN